MKAVTIETEAQQIFKALVKVLNRLVEAIRNYMDIGFMSVIKSLPVFSRQEAMERRKIKSLYGTDWNRYERKRRGKYVTVAGLRLKVAGEVDDSNRMVAGNWYRVSSKK